MARIRLKSLKIYIKYVKIGADWFHTPNKRLSNAYTPPPIGNMWGSKKLPFSRK